MFGHRADRPRRLAGGLPVARPSFAEAGKPFGAPITAETLTELDAHHWELYHVAEDPAENHNLAEQHRDRLIEMIAHVVRRGRASTTCSRSTAAGSARLMVERPQVAGPREQYVYRPVPRPCRPGCRRGC